MVSAVALLVAGGSQIAAASPRHKMRTQPDRVNENIAGIPPGAFKLNPCHKDLPVGSAVHVKIPTQITITDGKRHVRINDKPFPDDDEEQKPGWKNDSDSTDPNDIIKKSPFDIDVSSVASPNKKWVKVLFVLEDKFLTFARKDNTGADILGVYVDKDAHRSHLCQNDEDALSSIPGSPSGKINKLTLYVRLEKLQKNIPINIVVVGDVDAPSGADTPIIIDPKIRNNG